MHNASKAPKKDIQLSDDKKTGWLFDKGDYTTQFF